MKKSHFKRPETFPTNMNHFSTRNPIFDIPGAQTHEKSHFHQIGQIGQAGKNQDSIISIKSPLTLK